MAYGTEEDGYKEKVVAVSGGFDPPHIGHIKLFREARELGSKLVVIMNNDNWLMKKKGYVFMPENERRQLLESIRYVDEVVVTKHKENDTDVSVCKVLEKLLPDVFANGGDRKADNIPEYKTCEENGIEMIFNVGGNKIQSSSLMVKKAKLGKKDGRRK